MRRLIATAAAILLLTGLARPVSAQPAVTPAPAANVPAGSQAEYRISPQDTLDISVFGVENLTRTVQVDASGQINYPLIGGVVASGRTQRELGDEIAAKLGERYLQAPQVTVFVKSSFTRRFTVEGAVTNPGIYDLQGELTLLQAIATAKGVTPEAVIRKIVVFRTLDGVRKASIADLSAIRTGKVNDPQIYPGDLIVVSSSNSASQRWLRQLVSVTPLFYLFGL